jgi:NitT/TauT family transport system permease protein
MLLSIRKQIGRALLPLTTLAVLVALWHIAIVNSKQTILPTPWHVCLGLADLARRGLLLKYVVASLFRVTWGYLLAAVLAIPFGLMLGWYRRGGLMLNHLIEFFRPISPLAWIPISILWFGVGDLAAIFLIFLASFLPIAVASMSAVRNVAPTHVNAGRNFGLSEAQIILRVIYPSALPQLIIGLRIALGVAWLVVVAAEMIAVNSGLGFLIVDARNAGNRYDLVVGGMVMIGLIGLVLDTGMRRLEKFKFLRWGYGE